jgi:hypothetical protein
MAADSEESRTNFQLVRVVLDQLHADVAPSTGRTLTVLSETS